MAHFGVMIGSSVPLERIAKLARLAEQYKFDSIWTIDGAYGWDAFQVASVVARATSKINVRMAVVNPYDRHPIKTGLDAMTTQSIAKGRFGFGVGGGSLETLISLGHSWVHPTLYVREMIHVMRQLWTGETVNYNGKTVTAKRCKLWVDPPLRIPVYLGCQRPWMLRLAGEIADGVLINHGTKKHLPWSILRLNEGAARVGRDLEKDDFEILNLSIGAVAEDKATSYEWTKASIPYVFMNIDKWHMKDLGITPDDFKKVKEPLIVQTKETLQQAAQAVEDWMIKEFSAAGTPEDAIQHIKGYLETGINGVVLTVPVKPEGRAETCLQLLSEHVLPAFR
ncbi:MAG: LLM class flavin-dependent oxidoreductase [Candidatus Ranarchaeia archaeon]